MFLRDGGAYLIDSDFEIEQKVMLAARQLDERYFYGPLQRHQTFCELAKVIAVLTHYQTYHFAQIQNVAQLRAEFDKLAKKYPTVLAECTGQRYGQPTPEQAALLLSDADLSLILRHLRHLDLAQGETDPYAVAWQEMHRKAEKTSAAFFTPANLAQAMRFMVTAVIEREMAEWSVLDPACGVGTLLDAFKMDYRASKIVGIDVLEELSQVARLRLVSMPGYCRNINIYCNNALDPLDRWTGWGAGLDVETKSRTRRDLGDASFDVVVSNPPFGLGLVPEQLAYYELAKGRSGIRSEEAFIERCYQFLRPGGILGLIIPQSIVQSSKYRITHLWMKQHFDWLAQVAVPGTAFAPYTNLSTHLLILRKRSNPLLTSGKDEAQHLLDKPAGYVAEINHVGRTTGGKPDRLNGEILEDVGDVAGGFQEWLWYHAEYDTAPDDQTKR